LLIDLFFLIDQAMFCLVFLCQARLGSQDQAGCDTAKITQNLSLLGARLCRKRTISERSVAEGRVVRQFSGVQQGLNPFSGVNAFVMSCGPSRSEGFSAVRMNGMIPNKKAEAMSLYEHVFLARQDVSAQQVETMTETYKGIIESNGGSVTKVEYWGVKPLAYRIKKNRKAHYALFNLDAPPAAVKEMERQMAISEDILRFMTVRVDALEEGPSAMLQRRDRDDRPERGDRFDRGDRPDRAPRRRDADVVLDDAEGEI
jgi:small subunit ribosomal protein S6